MVEPISIGAITHYDFLKDKLDGEVRKLQSFGWRIALEESKSGEIQFVGCQWSDANQGYNPDGDLVDNLRHQVAAVVSDVIVNEWEGDLLKEIIQEDYYYFNEDERRTIYNYAANNLNKEHGCLLDDRAAKGHRQLKILQKLVEYLTVHNQLVVDGFIKFRLKEYLNELEESVERAVDDFIMEREYKEFVNLLRYFVEVQEPRMDQVHVTATSSRGFSLWDKDKNQVEGHGLEELMLDQSFQEINYEDMLVSALITLAPREVMLHFPLEGEYANTVSTLKHVFVNRVTVCSGCDWCATVH